MERIASRLKWIRLGCMRGDDMGYILSDLDGWHDLRMSIFGRSFV